MMVVVVVVGSQIPLRKTAADIPKRSTTALTTTKTSLKTTVRQSGESYKVQRSEVISELTCNSFAIPLVAYSFLGIEIIAVTAFEAKNSTSLRWPSRIIAYAVFVLYFLCTIGEILTVGWRDSHLPQIYEGLANSNNNSSSGPITPPNSTSLAVNAAWAAGYHNIAGFLNGCLIFSVLSASNTSLYVSSRTLFGLTHDVPGTNWFGKRVNKLSLVVRQTGVPAAALLFSAVSFFWLPFLQLKAGFAIQDVSCNIGRKVALSLTLSS
jgi:yeast amino acid transporter